MKALPSLSDYTHAKAGWKIHLTVPDAPDKTSFTSETLPIVEFCRANKVAYKVGQGGLMEEGKGMTLYIGPRLVMEDIARRLIAEGLDGHTPVGDVLVDDQYIAGNIRARYDVRGRSLHENILTPYGWQGIPFLRNDVIFYDNSTATVLPASAAIFQGSHKGEKNTAEELVESAHRALIGMHGEYYYGKGHGPLVGKETLDKLLNCTPVGFFNHPGPIKETGSWRHHPFPMLHVLINSQGMTLFNSGKKLLGITDPPGGTSPHNSPNLKI